MPKPYRASNYESLLDYCDRQLAHQPLPAQLTEDILSAHEITQFGLDDEFDLHNYHIDDPHWTAKHNNKTKLTQQKEKHHVN